MFFFWQIFTLAWPKKMYHIFYKGFFGKNTQKSSNFEEKKLEGSRYRQWVHVYHHN